MSDWRCLICGASGNDDSPIKSWAAHYAATHQVRPPQSR